MPTARLRGSRPNSTTAVGVIVALSASHLLNDTMQSLASALYPVFQQKFALTFFQIGAITLVFQITASFLQPLIGMGLDRRPVNGILPSGMAFTLVGLALLAFANSYPLILLSVAVVGVGSAVFHPEVPVAIELVLRARSATCRPRPAPSYRPRRSLRRTHRSCRAVLSIGRDFRPASTSSCRP